MEADLQVIQDNDAGTNGSFIYFLHREDSFDAPAFWRLYDGLVAVAAKRSPGDVSPAFARSLHRVHGQILSCFIRHLTGEEVLDGFPEHGVLEQYMERLEMAMDGCFTGVVMDERTWSTIHQLKNPNAHHDGEG